MADTQIIIEATDNGNPVNKTIKNINPDATNAQLATFGTMLNACTDNQYGQTTKITKVHCDAEAGGGDTRAVPTLEIWNQQKTEVITDLNMQTGHNFTVQLKYDGDGDILSTLFTNTNELQVVSVDTTNKFYEVRFLNNATGGGQVGDTFDVTFETTATENFKAGSVTLTVTVV